MVLGHRISMHTAPHQPLPFIGLSFPTLGQALTHRGCQILYSPSACGQEAMAGRANVETVWTKAATMSFSWRTKQWFFFLFFYLNQRNTTHWSWNRFQSQRLNSDASTLGSIEALKTEISVCRALLAIVNTPFCSHFTRDCATGSPQRRQEKPFMNAWDLKSSLSLSNVTSSLFPSPNWTLEKVAKGWNFSLVQWLANNSNIVCIQVHFWLLRTLGGKRPDR